MFPWRKKKAKKNQGNSNGRKKEEKVQIESTDQVSSVVSEHKSSHQKLMDTLEEFNSSIGNKFEKG